MTDGLPYLPYEAHALGIPGLVGVRIDPDRGDGPWFRMEGGDWELARYRLDPAVAVRIGTLLEGYRTAFLAATGMRLRAFSANEARRRPRPTTLPRGWHADLASAAVWAARPETGTEAECRISARMGRRGGRMEIVRWGYGCAPSAFEAARPAVERALSPLASFVDLDWFEGEFDLRAPSALQRLDAARRGRAASAP